MEKKKKKPTPNPSRGEGSGNAEEKKEKAHKAERRKYWAKLLYGKDSQGTTLILPEDSKLL